MDILKSDRLNWTITNSSLDDVTVSIDGNPLTRTDLDRLNQPIQLRTPNLVLNLPLFQSVDETDKVEFPTGNVVTPLEILGAIRTYYSLPMSEGELARLLEIVPARIRNKLLKANQNMPGYPQDYDHAWFMGDQIFFTGLTEEPDGSFTVGLGN